MSRGRHARPSPVPQYARNTGIGSIAALTLLMNQQGTASAAPDEVWAPVIDCESGGDPKAQNPNSTASGLYQIIDGTWAAYGGLEFSKRAKDATPEQQRVIAERILDEGFNSVPAQGPGAWVDPCNDALYEWIDAGSPEGDPVAAPPQPAVTPVDDAADTDVIPAVNEYRVEEGDYLADIAERYGTTWRELAELNGIAAPYTIYPGDILLLAPQEQEIVVQEGDWLSTIAQDLGICTPEDDITTCWEPLYEQNVDVVGPNPDVIVPGQVLHFVGGIALASTPQPVPDAPAPAPAVASTNGYAAPVQGASIGDGLGAGRSHQGQDLAIGLGTPVYAATDGYVDRADHMSDADGRGSAPDNGGYGNLVEVVAADGTMTRYAHLDTITVSGGAYVLAGEQIGTVGTTGDSTGPHLHFEVHDPSLGTLEPLPWLAEHGIVL